MQLCIRNVLIYSTICTVTADYHSTGAIVFIFPNTAAQAAIASILAVTSLAVTLHYRPYVDTVDRTNYIAGCVVIFLSMFLSLLLEVHANGISSSEHQDSTHLLSVLLILMNVLIVVVAFLQMAVAFRRSVFAVRGSRTPKSSDCDTAVSGHSTATLVSNTSTLTAHNNSDSNSSSPQQRAMRQRDISSTYSYTASNSGNALSA
jgi:uncharacterized membrane protein YcgQ (UPF0703/DUF1980 family)